jgi:acetyl esterase
MFARYWAFPLLFLSLFMICESNGISAELRRDVEYARVDGTSLRLDASIPEGPGPFPAAIIVHGGGWVAGDRRNNVQPLFQPLSEAGFAWFSVDYRLLTDVSQFGLAINDVQEAIRYVKAHAAEYRVDPARIALIGESAGGQLASMATLRGGSDTAVKAVVAIYTPTDLVSLLKNSTYVSASIRNSVIGTPWEGLVMGAVAQLSPLEQS